MLASLSRAAAALTVVGALASCTAGDDQMGVASDATGPESSGVPTSTAVSSPGPTSTIPPGDTGTVTRVLDGDSLIVRLADGSEEVRLVGINAPEATECYGDPAREALRALVDDEAVTLVEAGNEDRDRFGRLLRYAYTEAGMVNEEMVRAGHAVALQGDHERDNAWKALEEAAFLDGLGMWSPGACGTTGATDMRILGVEYDAPGRDVDNPNGEWTGLENGGEAPLDLGGWVLRDESSQHRFRFPDDFRLDAGGVVRIRSGCGEDTATELYWCAGDPVWSNGGDSAYLQDRAGNVRDRYAYAGDY